MQNIYILLYTVYEIRLKQQLDTRACNSENLLDLTKSYWTQDNLYILSAFLVVLVLKSQRKQQLVCEICQKWQQDSRAINSEKLQALLKSYWTRACGPVAISNTAIYVYNCFKLKKCSTQHCLWPVTSWTTLILVCLPSNNLYWCRCWHRLFLLPRI